MQHKLTSNSFYQLLFQELHYRIQTCYLRPPRPPPSTYPVTCPLHQWKEKPVFTCVFVAKIENKGPVCMISTSSRLCTIYNRYTGMGAVRGPPTDILFMVIFNNLLQLL